MPTRRKAIPFSYAYATLEAMGELAAEWNGSPPLERLGARLEFTRIDRVRAVLDPVLPCHLGGLGTDAVNGMILAGLFDLVIGTVGWLTFPRSRTATVNLSMSFIRATRGEQVTAEARLLHATSSLVFAAGEIRDGDNRITARCEGISAIAGRRSSGGLGDQQREPRPC